MSQPIQQKINLFQGDRFETLSILMSALASGILSDYQKELIEILANPQAVEIARSFNNPRLVRQLRLKRGIQKQLPELIQENDRIFYSDREIGKLQILYKSPLPGELQARLAYESAIERFLEYLQKHYQFSVLDESDFHVRVFIPKAKKERLIAEFWSDFAINVLFSINGDPTGDPKRKLPGLAQTFISMLKSVTLAGRGFSTLDIPIVTREQATVLAAWYFAVIREVKKRQSDRQKQIDGLNQQLESSEFDPKYREKLEKDLRKKQEMQDKEAEKYNEKFAAIFCKILEQHQSIFRELIELETQLNDTSLNNSKITKLRNQQAKLREKIVFSQDSIQQKYQLFQKSESNPFHFLDLNIKLDFNKFKDIIDISKQFTKIATDQINSTRGDIFSQCILEMYRLLETESLDTVPEPLLNEKPRLMAMRSPGDDGKDFCYSCGVELDPKKAEWKVARFMFERPSQRRQSSSSEDRPYICSSCSTLAFASPLKITDESIVIKLESKIKEQEQFSKSKIKDYLRMLTNKEIHLSSGRYIILASDKTRSGDLASQKLGQVQYALAKIASIFSLEVLTDFKFLLYLQGSHPKILESRNLILINGLMKGYKQSIVMAGKEINLKLGDAIRYTQQDSPILADYTLVKIAQICDRLLLEQVRERYFNLLQKDAMNDPQLQKRFKLYKNVAALTGLTYAFAAFLESTAKNYAQKNQKSKDYVEREVSKLIEQVDSAVNFCYYATLGDQNKTSVQATLFRDPSNSFIYTRTSELLKLLGIDISQREKEDGGKIYLQLYADDIYRAYAHFSDPNCEDSYAQDRDWKELTYNLKLSLYTCFPELVRKLKSTTEKN